MNNLVIGNTSQLAHYFPDDFIKVSSRNIMRKMHELKSRSYDRIYITFAEQRLHEITDVGAYMKVNHDLTLKIIDELSAYANTIVVYGSCELWNNCMGAITVNEPINYKIPNLYHGYCFSKHIMIKAAKKKYPNVIAIHPFNFNSPYRKGDFLFAKIFDSIINYKKIEIGDTYFYRDLVHPKYVVERSMLATEDELVGSGRLTFVNDFIRDLYKYADHDLFEYRAMKYEDYVTEKFDNKNQKPILYLKSNEVKYSYFDLLRDTIDDIEKFKKIKNENRSK